MSPFQHLPPLNDPRCALVVIDMQNDFNPGGQLAVQGGDEIVPLINRLGTLRARTGLPTGKGQLATPVPSG